MQVPLPPMSRWEDRNREPRDFRRVTQFISTIAVLEARCFHSWAPYFSPLAVWLTGEGMPGKVGWWGHPGLVKDQGQSEEISHQITIYLGCWFLTWPSGQIFIMLWKTESLVISQEFCLKITFMRMSKGYVIIRAICQVACLSCHHCLKLLTGHRAEVFFSFFFRLGSGRLQTSRSYGLGLHYLSVSIKSSHLQSIRVHIPSPRHHRSPSCLFLRHVAQASFELAL